MITVTVEKTGEEFELLDFIMYYAELLGIDYLDSHPELDKLWEMFNYAETV